MNRSALLALVAVISGAAVSALGAAAPVGRTGFSIEVASELVPLPGFDVGDLPQEALRSIAPPLAGQLSSPAARVSVAEQLGTRIAAIRVTWYDANRVESAAEAERLVRAWWLEPASPVMERHRWANNSWGPKMIHAELRESDGSVGWLLIEHGYPSVRAAWKDGAGHWRFTHHVGSRQFLLNSERPERILPRLTSAGDDELVLLLSKLSAVGDGDERVSRGAIPFLRHPRPEVRGVALDAVIAGGRPSDLVFESLNTALRDPDSGVRVRALWILHRNGRVAVDLRFMSEVLAILGDENERVRSAACEAAGHIGRAGDPEVGRRVVEAVAPCLRDPNAGVRMAAATAMSSLWTNGSSAIPVLAALPPDPEDGVRNAVASALRSLREVHAKPIEGVDVDFGVPIP